MSRIKRKKLNLSYISFCFSVFASFTGSALLYLFLPNLKETLTSFAAHLGYLMVFGLFIVLLVSFYSAFQFLTFFILSNKNFGLTYRHYRGLIKESSPLYKINLSVLIILAFSLFWLSLQINTKVNDELQIKELLKLVAAVFGGFGVLLISTIYFLVEFKYKKWAIKKDETLSMALANTSGLMSWDKKENKDSLVLCP